MGSLETAVYDPLRAAHRRRVQDDSGTQKPEQQEAGSVSDDVLGFLLSLQEEGADTI